MRDSFFLFAYGSLRAPAGTVGDLLGGCERVGDATVHGTLYDVGEYPALLLSGDRPVRGEIWRCPVDRLAALDHYEGVAEGLFRRGGVRVDGRACWVYVAGPRLGHRLRPGALLRR